MITTSFFNCVDQDLLLYAAKTGKAAAPYSKKIFESIIFQGNALFCNQYLNKCARTAVGILVLYNSLK